MAKLLLVEDEEHIANGLKFNLELEGHEVTWLHDGSTAREALIDRGERYDLVILDIMLPGMSGLDLCRALRKVENYTPVLMLTARQYDKDKVHGLQMGADDYVTKPFNLEELLARADGLLRRQRWAGTARPEEDVLRFRDVTINFTTCEVHVGDREVKLTPIEMMVMKLFKEHEGHVLTREDLLKDAWGTDAPITTRTVDNFIMRLRKLFELDPANPAHILSVRGRGYKFVRG
ncbi:MAG TPA: response regulator transcription factor [Oscillatoriaceae cyanobacterium]